MKISDIKKENLVKISPQSITVKTIENFSKKTIGIITNTTHISKMGDKSWLEIHGQLKKIAIKNNISVKFTNLFKDKIIFDNKNNFYIFYNIENIEKFKEWKNEGLPYKKEEENKIYSIDKYYLALESEGINIIRCRFI